MPDPLVSCVCPTYGRYPREGHLLNEAVYWFGRNRERYPNCELVILNDAPEQQLACDAPGVRVVNLTERLPDLGTKCNVLLGLARGAVVLPWDDDDVSLPDRVEAAVARLGAADYWNPRASWYQAGPGTPVRPIDGCVCHNASAFRAGRLWYRPVHGHDRDADGRAVRTLRTAPPLAAAERPLSGYVYRWGVSRYHLSAGADQLARYAAAPPPAPGRFRIEPARTEDYERLVADARDRPAPR